MRREIITWSAVALLVVAAFFGTVLVLNSTLYSANGFVRGYLDALARHDAEGALQLAGTVAAGDASRELLVAGALGQLDGIRLVSDTEDDAGTHTVVYAFEAGGDSGESTFSVRRTGTLLGLFPSWEFVSSPLGVLQALPQHAREFTVNGVAVQAAEQDKPSPYLVFAPGSYTLASASRYLEADPVVVTASQPGAAVIGTVDIQPTGTFLRQVGSELRTFLDDCARQTVLLPTGCPFGQQMNNRIASIPAWSMSIYPRVTLVPGPQPGTWLMPPTEGAAHLVVDVKSLFDGSVSTFDEDVPFTSSYLVTFLGDDKLSIAAR